MTLLAFRVPARRRKSLDASSGINGLPVARPEEQKEPASRRTETFRRNLVSGPKVARSPSANKHAPLLLSFSVDVTPVGIFLSAFHIQMSSFLPRPPNKRRLPLFCSPTRILWSRNPQGRFAGSDLPERVPAAIFWADKFFCLKCLVNRQAAIKFKLDLPTSNLFK